MIGEISITCQIFEATLKALEGHSFEFLLLFECHDCLQKLGVRYKKIPLYYSLRTIVN